jgi:tRNA(adenine34) deaminase
LLLFHFFPTSHEILHGRDNGEMPSELLDDPGCRVQGEQARESVAKDEAFMRLALEQARIGKDTAGAGEVGCVIVVGGEVVASGYNEAEMRSDPTAHAEIVALRRLGATTRSIEFRGATLYCTLQCCTMCTAACIWAKVSRIVYGATRKDVHSMYFDARDLDTVDLVAAAFKNDTAVVGGILAEECAALYVGPQEPVPVEEQTNL